MADLGIAALNSLGNLNGITGLFQDENSMLDDPKQGFGDVLADTLKQYQTLEAGNSMDTLSLLTGNTEDLSSTIIASEKADLALNLTISLRNKAIGAYNQIMNMQI